MYKWLPSDQTSNIPSYAHTMVGVGGLVINEKSEVLVVSEKHFNYPHWKLPGGMVDPGIYLYVYTHSKSFAEWDILAATTLS